MNSAQAWVPAAHSCGIAVMAKASAPGRTKTRLVPPLTGQEAAAFNTAFLQDISANMLAAGKVRRIQPYMAYGPPGPDSVAFFRNALPGEVGLLEAWWPDFGDCLYGAIDQLLTLGHASAVVLNSDSPTLPTSLLVETAEVLSHPGDRAVLGPSTDGGYYLLGLKARHRRLFEEVTWSTDQVAEQTLARAAEIGLSVHLLPAWYDVDDAQSLSVLYGELFEDRPFSRRHDRHRAASSARLMRMLLARSDLAARLDRSPSRHRGRRRLSGGGDGMCVTARKENSFMQESSPAEIAVDPRRYFESVSAVRGAAVRKPVCLYLETTNRCNLLCTTCPRTYEELEPPADMS